MIKSDIIKNRARTGSTGLLDTPGWVYTGTSAEPHDMSSRGEGVFAHDAATLFPHVQQPKETLVPDMRVRAKSLQSLVSDSLRLLLSTDRPPLCENNPSTCLQANTVSPQLSLLLFNEAASPIRRPYSLALLPQITDKTLCLNGIAFHTL